MKTWLKCFLRGHKTVHQFIDDSGRPGLQGNVGYHCDCKKKNWVIWG